MINRCIEITPRTELDIHSLITFFRITVKSARKDCILGNKDSARATSNWIRNSHLLQVLTAMEPLLLNPEWLVEIRADMKLLALECHPEWSSDTRNVLERIEDDIAEIKSAVVPAAVLPDNVVPLFGRESSA